ncbi:tRNA(Met) cytidine acetate ligase [Paenibacillus sp. 481]|uniref:tRNA(Met) cytidine acetate ligase n=1 Tax=Paenibacillus sp. 481 TaxID=2835869 RepID=UPI001E32395D|nr:nucleotidyltransferase family protein [Paenibacillus sp. 481]UHA73987.1 nucleotidyltransferase family protein [Paenibacillus sp. 481]
MKTVGIVVEYNPLHNGHLYHLQQSLKLAQADAAVAVMSGHFLQRGEPALVDKWTRTEMALAQGVDLVLELPVAYAVQPAEWFAYGAVATLHATGVVNSLCFGSEEGSLQPLLQAADNLTEETTQFSALLKAELKAGRNYPAAYAAAAAACSNHAQEHANTDQIAAVNSHDLAKINDGGAVGADANANADGDAVAESNVREQHWMEQPNNSLGLHYVMALRRLRSSIEPLTIARQQAGYHDMTAPAAGTIASATAIRRLMLDEGGFNDIARYVPPTTLALLERELAHGRAPISWERYSRELLYRLTSASHEELKQYLEVTEGLEHRVKQALTRIETPTVEALLQALKTKRYTRTKLQRMLAHVLLNHHASAFGRTALERGPAYIRVLGFSERGRELLKQMKRSAALPIVSQVTRDNCSLGGANGLTADVRATAVYAGAFSPWDAKAALRDYYEPPRRSFSKE